MAADPGAALHRGPSLNSTGEEIRILTTHWNKGHFPYPMVAGELSAGYVTVMIFTAAAILVAGLHVVFLAFVLLGALLVLRHQQLVWLHLPCVIYGVAISVIGWTCPLTPLENFFWAKAGHPTYQGGFLAHYLVQPLGLTRLTPAAETLVGVVLFCTNAVFYTVLLRHKAAETPPDNS